MFRSTQCLGFRAASAKTFHFNNWATIVCLSALALGLAAAPGRAEVIIACGFENVGDYWSYTSSNDQNCGVNTDAGVNDYPANARILNGSGSWFVNGTISVLTFSEVLLSGWKDVRVGYHISSTSTSENGGCRTDDNVGAYVALSTYANQLKPAFGDTPDIRLLGRGSGARWEYENQTPPVEKNAGWRGTLYPIGDGLRTTDGYSDFSIKVPNERRSLALKLYIQNGRSTDFWNIDDVTVEGTATTSRDCHWSGGGQWNNDSQNKRWERAESGGELSTWDSANGDNALFSLPGEAVTIAGGTMIAARSLRFEADGYVIESGDSSSRLALTNGGSGGSGANTVDVVDAAHTATIKVPIIANPGVGLTKTGGGTLVLGRSNLYTGPTAINEGVVCVSAANNLGAAGAGVAFDGGTLRLTKTMDLADNHPFALLDGGGVIDTQNFNCTTLTDNWSGGGYFTKIGTGKLVLQGDNEMFSGRIDVQQGILQLESNGAIAACSVLDLGADAILDVTGIAEGYSLGANGAQILQGAGTVLGNLSISELGVHVPGKSPCTQYVDGDYSMNGVLEIEIAGSATGAEPEGYDQVRISGLSHDVSLGGLLSLQWSGTDWAAEGDRLWIIRNDTAGSLSGAFDGLADGDLAGVYDGFHWRIYYGADADEGLLAGGNDVLLVAAAPVPEPGSIVSLLLACLAALAGRRREKRACHPRGLC